MPGSQETARNISKIGELRRTGHCYIIPNCLNYIGQSYPKYTRCLMSLPGYESPSISNNGSVRDLIVNTCNADRLRQVPAYSSTNDSVQERAESKDMRTAGTLSKLFSDYIYSDIVY